MKFNSQQIADLVNGVIEGDKNAEVNFFSKIDLFTFRANDINDSI